MSVTAGHADLVAAFPAAGSGGETLRQVEERAVRRGMAFVAMTNPPSIEALTSGRWQAGSVGELRRTAARVSARRVVLVGHCMGGLSALRLGADLDAALALTVSVLLINTPCPGPDGRIPTMSKMSDAQIADLLARDDFPQDLLDDEDMLAEIAEGLRSDARVADRIAEWVAATSTFPALHVLSTRGDSFVPPQFCTGWWTRTLGEFRLTVADGGHTIDAKSADAFDRAITALLDSVREVV